jgi:hypothetical protein
MGTPAPDAINRLVDHSDQNRKVFQSGEYKEEQLRMKFLNPFFESLGWDMDNPLATIRAGNWRSVPLFTFPLQNGGAGPSSAGTKARRHLGLLVVDRRVAAPAGANGGKK